MATGAESAPVETWGIVGQGTERACATWRRVRIPHPSELRLWNSVPAHPGGQALERSAERAKFHIIHIDRTNPISFQDAPKQRAVEAAGLRVAQRLEVIAL